MKITKTTQKRCQLKEQAKKNNLELVAEQKRLLSSWRELQIESERQFGEQIQHASDRIAQLDKEIEDMREETVQLDISTR